MTAGVSLALLSAVAAAAFACSLVCAAGLYLARNRLGGQAPGPDLEADIKQFVKDRIAPYKYPRWIEFVGELPKTATGKIQRFKLRQ